MKKLFTLIILLSAFLFPAQDSLVFIIRVDDIQSRNTTTLPRSINDFQNAVETRGGKVTWAVIPHRLIETQNYNGILSAEIRASALRGHEVSLHGYNHICQRCNGSSHEMYCTATQTPFTLSQQLALLDSGMKVLWDSLGIVPKSFVPPGHAADTTTWAALTMRGFPWLSSTGVRKNFIYNNLYNLAPHNEFTWQLTQSQFTAKLNQALAEIKTNGVSDGYYCLLLHDPFIRAGYENGVVINWTAALLDSLNAYFGSRIKYMTISEAGAYFRDGITTNIRDNKNLAGDSYLLQNFPNPFSGSTQISYTVQENNKPADSRRLTEAGGYINKISLKVYDLLGREVATLADGYQQAGKYNVVFNSSGLPNGIYYYRLQAGEVNETRKMIILR
ncbi:MAG: DUF2334 domain-containing protein [Ignavibacteriaceae bacterium]|nr:DUF2334 domain-containing protein [Ignavibacteriaceae bacterium]